MSTEVELITVDSSKQVEPVKENCTPCDESDCTCNAEGTLKRVLSGQEEHEVVTHDDHVDFVINGQLHHPHDSHFDHHGIYDPSKHSKITGFTKTFRSLVRHDYPEPENVKRQYNLNEDDKKAMMESQEKKREAAKKDQCRLLSMMFLTGGFMVIEFIGGIVAKALALQADAMHMASDLISLVVGYWAIKMSQKPGGDNNTFGWSRFEVLGATINSIFLLAVCFNIIVEACTRLLNIDEVKEGMSEKGTMYLVIAVIGLLINLLGLVFFGCCGDGSDPHGHHHHHHGHAHGHGHDHHHHDHDEDEHEHEHEHEHHEHEHHEHEHEHHEHEHEHHEHEHEHHEHEHEHEHDHHEHEHHEHEHHDHDHHDHVTVEMGEPKKKKAKRSANIQAVFLHVMGDALGSVAAIIAACCIKFIPASVDTHDLRFYADPLCSLFIVVLILHNCIPLFKSVMEILLQTAPRDINMKKLKEEILKVPGVEFFHGLHVWQLNEDINIGSIHIICSQESNHQQIMDEVKMLFHKANIHTSTVQIEIVRDEGAMDVCNDVVCAEKNCISHHCCAAQRIEKEMSESK